jgi:hypothetical protein
MANGPAVPTVTTMTTASVSVDAPPTAGRRAFVAGWICLVGAVIGIVCGLYTGFVTPAVGDELYRYPFTSGEYVAAQVVFAVNHLMLLAGVFALYRARAARGGAWTTGVALSVIGLLAWTACELWAISLVHMLKTAAAANAVNTGYGISNNLIGVGLIVTGVAVVRARRWSGWPRCTPLILGIAVFVIVLPGVFGPFLAGRLAISLWMVGWAALGAALIRNQAG